MLSPFLGLVTSTCHVAQICRFEGPGVGVLLMSLKCGVGLNLTCANTVILTEPWWNPFAEEQVRITSSVSHLHRASAKSLGE